jgi:hypothetical protein
MRKRGWMAAGCLAQVGWAAAPAALDALLGAHFDAARTPDGSLSAGMIANAAAVAALVDIAAKLPRLGLIVNAPGFLPETLHTIHTREDTPARLDPQALALARQAVLQLLLQLDRDLP